MTRARQQTARIDSRLEKPTTDRSFVWRGRVSLPLHLSSEGETGRKNEVANGHENHFVNGHENHGVGVHYGVAPGGVMAPHRELPTTARRYGLCGLRHGGPGFILHQTRNRDSL